MPLTYAIADLHGRFDLLTAAFEGIFKDAILRGEAGEKVKIVTLGDYVDRGPQSREIVEYLMAAQAAGASLICLKGNHEQMMHDSLVGATDMGWWMANGGQTALKSYNNDVPRSHLHWINNLPTNHVDEHRVFVHAGIDPTKALDEQTDEYMLWSRYVDNADVGHGKRHVVHGHTPNPHGPERYENRTNLDTLAWRTGRLIIAVFDDAKPGPAVGYIEIKKP
jgi:serine/threonine protein phosphatase 1